MNQPTSMQYTINTVSLVQCQQQISTFVWLWEILHEEKLVIPTVSAKSITLEINYLLRNGLFGQALWTETCSVNGTN